MYYLLLAGVCVITTFRSVFNQAYIKLRGSAPRSVYSFSALATLIFSVMLLAITGFRLEISLFSLILAVLVAVANVTCIYASFKVMEEGGISKNTLFLNLGGLLLPFFYGLLFNSDTWTVGKFICLACVIGALFVNLEKGEKSSLKIKLYSMLIFMLNGLACVAISFHQNNFLGFEAVSTESFTILYALLNSLFGAIILLFLPRDKQEARPTRKAVVLSLVYTAIFGLLYGFGNYLMTICLLHIEPSYQFPIMTGGGVVLAGLAGIPFGEKITKRFVLSSVLVVAGTIALVF